MRKGVKNFFRKIQFCAKILSFFADFNRGFKGFLATPDRRSSKLTSRVNSEHIELAGLVFLAGSILKASFVIEISLRPHDSLKELPAYE
jgi:hypothetical protein